MAQLRIFVVCYGDAHLAMLQQALCKSLLQQRNIEALQYSGAVVSLYSDPESITQALSICSELGKVDPHVITLGADPGRVQQACILEEIQRCIDADALMLMACPDNVWGDGSIGNLLAIAGEERGVCVAVPHPRVDADKFLPWWQAVENVDNSALVSMAWETLHPSWRAAFPARETSTSAAGIAIRPAALNLWAVTHLLPTVFLARFTNDDSDLFRACIDRGDVGIWDHVWPELLVRQGRLRTVGSSDAAFVAELTPADSHNVVLSPYDPANPTAYHRTGAHISAGRGVVAVWRGA